MAPESMVSGYVPRSSFDVYSLGAMLYELYCNEYLYEFMVDHVQQQNPSISKPKVIAKKARMLLIKGEGPAPRSFCNIENEHSELFNMVVDSMLVPEEHRKSATTLLNDQLFQGVDTSGGALT